LHLTDFWFCFENLHCYIFIHYDGNIHAVRVTSSYMLTLFLCTWLHGFPYLPIGIMWNSNWLLVATQFWTPFSIWWCYITLPCKTHNVFEVDAPYALKLAHPGA
jgi:hypothetical protein